MQKQGSNGTQHSLALRVPRDQPVAQIDISKLPRQELARIVEYRLCEFMGSMGFSNRAMKQFLGLDPWHVSWRLKRAGIHRKDYRDGKSPLAGEVIGRLDAAARRRFVENLERLLLK